MVRDYFTFGDINTLDYECIVTDKSIDTIPNRNIEMISVEGRNGDLYIDHGDYKNVDISYTLFFKNKYSMRKFASEISRVSGYAILDDSEFPTEYMYAVLTNIDSSRVGYSHDKCILKVNFNAKPKRFIKEGDVPIYMDITGGTSGYKHILNNTLEEARPIIEILGCSETSTFTFYVNGYPIKVTPKTSTIFQKITIDCELEDCYFSSNKSNANTNVYLELGFPKLSMGNNIIRYQSTNNNISLRVTPKWWRV